MKHSAHVTFITGSMTQIDVDAADADHARELVFAKFAPGTVTGVYAWPVVRSPVTINVGAHRAPAFDSSFGCLV